jgi:hypothetical protein
VFKDALALEFAALAEEQGLLDVLRAADVELLMRRLWGE